MKNKFDNLFSIGNLSQGLRYAMTADEKSPVIAVNCSDMEG